MEKSAKSNQKWPKWLKVTEDTYAKVIQNPQKLEIVIKGVQNLTQVTIRYKKGQR